MSEGKFPYFKQVALGALAGIGTLGLIIGGFSISGVGTVPQNTTPSSTQAAVSPSPSTSITANSTRTCSVATQAADTRLGTFSGIVINADNDEVLFDRNGSVPAATASTMKLLTAVAALNVLGPNYRVETKVYQDSADQGSIYLVGAGDPTLSRTAAGKQSVYKDAPKLSDLAIGVKAAIAVPITKITLVSSAFAGPSWEPTWERSEQTQGFISEVTALQVDGDRANPSAETSARSTTSVLNAGKYFKAALGTAAANAVVQQGTLPNGVTQVTSVLSQPISQWIKHMLLVSDNTQAEALARLVSIKQGFDGSFTSISAAVKRALASTALDSSNLVIKDGSGLSDQNAVPPLYLAKLSKLIMGAQGNYNVVLQGMPVAGESGSLQDRFKGANLDASGHIIAKTGWIKHGYTLAGIINAKDGTHLVFAVYALGDVKDDAKQAIDDLVGAVWRCGNTLSNQ